MVIKEHNGKEVLSASFVFLFTLLIEGWNLHAYWSNYQYALLVMLGTHGS